MRLTTVEYMIISNSDHFFWLHSSASPVPSRHIQGIYMECKHTNNLHFESCFAAWLQLVTLGTLLCSCTHAHRKFWHTSGCASNTGTSDSVEWLNDRYYLHLGFLGWNYCLRVKTPTDAYWRAGDAQWLQELKPWVMTLMGIWAWLSDLRHGSHVLRVNYPTDAYWRASDAQVTRKRRAELKPWIMAQISIWGWFLGIWHEMIGACQNVLRQILNIQVYFLLTPTKHWYPSKYHDKSW